MTFPRQNPLPMLNPAEFLRLATEFAGRAAVQGWLHCDSFEVDPAGPDIALLEGLRVVAIVNDRGLRSHSELTPSDCISGNEVAAEILADARDEAGDDCEE